MSFPTVAERGRPASEYELQADYERALQARQREHGAPAAAVEALMYELRSRGQVALNDQANQNRLAGLAPKQVDEVIERLFKLKPRYPAITDDLLLFIGRCRHG